MRKNKISKIPEFKTYEEEANFWDTHDFTEFEDETREVDMVVKLDQPKQETLILRLQKDVKDGMKKIARRNGLGVSALARLWILEKLRANRSSFSPS